jgi:hypothetical protein
MVNEIKAFAIGYARGIKELSKKEHLLTVYEVAEEEAKLLGNNFGSKFVRSCVQHGKKAAELSEGRLFLLKAQLRYMIRVPLIIRDAL